MDRYQIIDKAGDGNFSVVYKAIDTQTQQVVAIKHMKNAEQVEELIWRELKILSTVRHPNIIKAKQILQYKKDIKVVFEYIPESLLQFYQNVKKGVSQNQIRCILYQAAFALDYLHSQKKIIHRDIKPQNILINKKQAIVKLIDFGLAKQEQLASTNYVATRWYRAPENLINLSKSTTAIDIFALGCVIYEIATLSPLFPGDNTVDQLAKVFNILGTPTEDNWLQGYRELQRKGVAVLKRQKVDLKLLMPNSSDELVDLLDKMLQLNPSKRCKARQIMQHPFFSKVQKVIPTAIYIESKKYLQQLQNIKQGLGTRDNLLRDVSPNFKMRGTVNANDSGRNKSLIKYNTLPEQMIQINPGVYPQQTTLPHYSQAVRAMNKSIEPRNTMNTTLRQTTHVPFVDTKYKGHPIQQIPIRSPPISIRDDRSIGGQGTLADNRSARSYREMDSFGGNRVAMRNTYCVPNTSIKNNFIKRIGF